MTLTCAEAVRALGGDLRWERRPAGIGSKGPPRPPGARPVPPRSGTPARPRHDPADRPRGPAAHRRRHRPPMVSGPHRALVRLDARPPGTVTLVPPAHPARTRPGNHPEPPG